jgi:hypothetical protein
VKGPNLNVCCARRPGPAGSGLRNAGGTPGTGCRQHYDLAQHDLLGLQDFIAAKVTAALKVQVTAAERERVYRRYTQNAAAYDAYSRGQAVLAYPTYATEEQMRAAEVQLTHAAPRNG